MALVTENLGFGVTAGTAYEHPYPFARRMSTLDHLTNGRVGWNVVTGYLPSAARNMGHEDQLEHDDRYDVADEYLEVLYKLWEGSWEDDAVVRNRETGVFTDLSKVHEIGHSGKFVIPELRKRGAYPEKYVEGSLRNKLHGNGNRLPEDHKGASYRIKTDSTV